MAEKMGAGLGGGAVLLRALPSGGEAVIRRLVLVLGDQLDRDAAVLADLDPARDAVVMTEAREEASYLRQHKKRLVLFFSAMRHFAEELRGRGITVHYHALDGEAPAGTLAEGAARHEAEEIHVTRPGDWRVLEALKSRFPGIVVHEDSHFLSGIEEFRRLCGGAEAFHPGGFLPRDAQAHRLADGRGRPRGWRLEFRQGEPQGLRAGRPRSHAGPAGLGAG